MTASAVSLGLVLKVLRREIGTGKIDLNWVDTHEEDGFFVLYSAR